LQAAQLHVVARSKALVRSLQRTEYSELGYSALGYLSRAVPVQMWAGAAPSLGADVGGAS
jgi:hypothetical protein